jgi:hypothetical protein
LVYARDAPRTYILGEALLCAAIRYQQFMPVERVLFAPHDPRHDRIGRPL